VVARLRTQVQNARMLSLRRRTSGIVVRRVEADLLVLDLEGNSIHRLNPTAGLIWENHDECRSEEELAELLVARFVVELDVALHDVRSTLNSFAVLNLLVPA
jgi:hypothetical protein